MERDPVCSFARGVVRRSVVGNAAGAEGIGRTRGNDRCSNRGHFAAVSNSSGKLTHNIGSRAIGVLLHSSGRKKFWSGGEYASCPLRLRFALDHRARLLERTAVDAGLKIKWNMGVFTLDGRRSVAMVFAS